MDLGVQVLLSSRDPVLARLLSSRSPEGLPAAAAYASYTKATINDHHPLEATQGGGHLNAAGSLLDTPDDALLTAAFKRLNVQLGDLAGGDDFAAWHNQLALYWDARLRAVTGARPIGLLWQTTSEVDWDRGFCHIADKTVSSRKESRLAPLPKNLLHEFRESYVHTHLPELREWLGQSNLDALSHSDLLFLLQPGTHGFEVAPITFTDRRKLGLEEPLPTNLMRHRLRTWLHQHGGDIEVIDSIFGHHDGATLTHGAYSMRVWLSDATAILPLIDGAEASLKIVAPPSWHGTKGLAPRVVRDAGVAADDQDEPQDKIGREQRRRETRDEAMASIRSEVLAALGNAARPIRGARSLLDQLAMLSEKQMGTLTSKLLRTSKGLPRPNGLERVEVLQRLAECSWRHRQRPLKLSRRYFSPESEESPFKRSAPRAGSLVPMLRQAVDDSFAACPHASKISAKAAILLALCDLIINTGVTNPLLLAAVAQTPSHLRLITLKNEPYIEWAPLTSLEDHPEAAVQRLRVSERLAVLLSKHVLGVSRVADFRDSSIDVRVRTSRLLALPSDTTFELWLDAIREPVQQDNAICLPGTVAAMLDGRLLTASLDQSDWLMYQTGLRAAAPWQLIGARLTTTLNASPLTVGGSADRPRNELVLADLQRRSASDYLALIRREIRSFAAAPGQRASTQKRRDVFVDELDNKIDAYCAKAANAHLSSAARFIGHWAVELLRQKRPNGYAQLQIESVERYLAALAPQFRQLAYDVDLPELEPAEVGEFYRSIVQTSPAKDKNYLIERLRQFHKFAQTNFGANPCDWSEVSPGERTELGAPGLIDDPLYDDILAAAVNAEAPVGIEAWQCAAVIVLQRRFGLRSREVLSLTLQDVHGWPERPVVAVRRRQGLRLKSPAARRVIPLIYQLSALEKSILQRLIVRQSNAAEGFANAPLLAKGHDPMSPLPLDAVRAHVNRVLRATAGRMGLTSHDLRHAFGNDLWRAIEAFLWESGDSTRSSALYLDAARSLILGHETSTPSRRGMWAIARLLGHAHPATTLRAYIHLVPEVASRLRYTAPSFVPNWSRPPAFDALTLEQLAPTSPFRLDDAKAYMPLTPRATLESIKLLTGCTSDRAEWILDLCPGTLRDLPDLVSRVESRLTALDSDADHRDIGDGKTSSSRGTTTRGQHIRAGANGLLSMVRRSSYLRLRTGLEHARAIAPNAPALRHEEFAAMIGPAGEISVWTQAQFDFVVATIEAAAAGLSRVSARVATAHLPWAEEMIRSGRRAFKLSASSQLPRVRFPSSGTSQDRRIALLLNDGASGFAYNRAELILVLSTVYYCTRHSDRESNRVT